MMSVMLQSVHIHTCFTELLRCLLQGLLTSACCTPLVVARVSTCHTNSDNSKRHMQGCQQQTLVHSANTSVDTTSASNLLTLTTCTNAVYMHKGRHQMLVHVVNTTNTSDNCVDTTSASITSKALARSTSAATALLHHTHST
jgi:hypothetical protein